MDVKERRRRERVEFVTSAVLVAGGREVVSQSTENLSLQGVFVRCAETLEPGTPCRVYLELTGRSSRLQLRMDGKVVRGVQGKGVAIEFTAVDLDSYTYLKSIIEHNRPGGGEESNKNLAVAD